MEKLVKGFKNIGVPPMGTITLREEDLKGFHTAVDYSGSSQSSTPFWEVGIRN